MVLLVERQVTSTIRRVRCGGNAGARPAAKMRDGGGRGEQDAPAACPDRGAQVDVLGVEEVPFVEQSSRLKIHAIGQQRGAADPVHVLLATRRLGHAPFHPADTPLVQCESPFLSQFGQRRDHRAEGHLRPAGAIDQSRSGDCGFRSGGQPRDERVDRARRDHAVAVQQQDQLTGRSADARVVGGREAAIRALLDHPNGMPAGANGVRAAIVRPVVHDHNLVGHRGRRRDQRVETALEIRPGIEADDHDRKPRVHRRPAQDSSASSVLAAATSQE